MIQGLLVFNYRNEELKIKNKFGVVPDDLSNYNLTDEGFDQENFTWLISSKRSKTIIFLDQVLIKDRMADIRHDILNILNYIYVSNSMLDIEDDISKIRSDVGRTQEYIENEIKTLRTKINQNTFFPD